MPNDYTHNTTIDNIKGVLIKGIPTRIKPTSNPHIYQYVDIDSEIRIWLLHDVPIRMKPTEIPSNYRAVNESDVIYADRIGCARAIQKKFAVDEKTADWITSLLASKYVSSGKRSFEHLHQCVLAGFVKQGELDDWYIDPPDEFLPGVRPHSDELIEDAS